MSHQHSRGALLFGRKRLCPTDQCCAFSANSSCLLLLRNQGISGQRRERAKAPSNCGNVGENARAVRGISCWCAADVSTIHCARYGMMGASERVAGNHRRRHSKELYDHHCSK